MEEISTKTPKIKIQTRLSDDFYKISSHYPNLLYPMNNFFQISQTDLSDVN